MFRPRTPRLHLTGLTATVALTGALLTACNGSGGSDAVSSPSVVSGTPSAPADSPAPTAAAVSPTSSPSATLPSSSQLRAALLTAADLGSPFQVNPSPGSATTHGCEPLATILNGTDSTLDTGAGNEADIELQAPDGNPTMDEGLVTEQPAQLRSDVAHFDEALTTCRSLTLTTSKISVQLTVSPVQFDANATTVRLDGTLLGHELIAYVSVENLGPAALLFSYSQIDHGSSQLAYALDSRAVAKARNSLGATEN